MGKPVQLWIAGDGPFRAEIEQEISRLGLSANVRLLGQLADARVFYQAMDVFLLNSIREGLPNVVLEAMALDVPVVATRVAGVPTLVKPGQTGWLIEPGEMGMLDSALAECLEGSHTVPRVYGAKELIQNQFSFDRRMKRIAGIYDSLAWR
jgi:glycosyltransferase involved in cell wall biosynthesis